MTIRVILPWDLGEEMEGTATFDFEAAVQEAIERLFFSHQIPEEVEVEVVWE